MDSLNDIKNCYQDIICPYCNMLLQDPVLLPCSINVCRKHVIGKSNHEIRQDSSLINFEKQSNSGIKEYCSCLMTNCQNVDNLVNELTKYEEGKKNKFPCFCCNRIHVIPPEGYIPNKAMDVLIYTKLGKEKWAIIKSISDIEAQLNEHLNNNKSKHEVIINSLNETKRQVKEHTDKLISGIQQQAEEIISQINSLQEVVNLEKLADEKSNCFKPHEIFTIKLNNFMNEIRKNMTNKKIGAKYIRSALDNLSATKISLEKDLSDVEELNESIIRKVYFIPIEDVKIGELIVKCQTKNNYNN